MATSLSASRCERRPFARCCVDWSKSRALFSRESRFRRTSSFRIRLAFSYRRRWASDNSPSFFFILHVPSFRFQGPRISASAVFQPSSTFFSRFSERFLFKTSKPSRASGFIADAAIRCLAEGKAPRLRPIRLNVGFRASNGLPSTSEGGELT